MKKVFYISLLLITAIACKKDQVLPEADPVLQEKMDTASNSNIPFLKVISSVSETTPHALNNGNYAYDDHGRLSFYITDAFTEIFNYTSDNKISILRLGNEPEIKIGSWDAALNAKGAITKLIYYDAEGTAQSKEIFEYDADGYMVKRSFYNQLDAAGSFEEQYTIQNGLLKKKTYIVGNIPQYEISYTYGATRTALMLQTGYAVWFSEKLFGKTWERVATASQKRDIASNKIVDEFVFECSVDAEGYVVSKSTKNKQNAMVSNLEIVY